MSPDDRDKVMFRLLSAWSRPLPDSTQLVWIEHLNGLDFDRAIKAMHALERESKHRPALSEFHDAYNVQPGKGGHAVAAPDCGVCGGSGFVEVGPNTVTKCPSGCKPMTAEQRQVKEERERIEYERHRQRSKVGAGQRPIDFTEPGSRAEPEMDF